MTLAEAVVQYVAWKRGNGYQFFSGIRILRQLTTYVGESELVDVKPEHMLGCLNRSPSNNSTWTNKYWVMRRFLEYCSSREMMPALEMPVPRVAQRNSFVPYIFTTMELRSLLEATKSRLSMNYIMDQPTLRAIIVLLYATGIPVGEICTVRKADVDLSDGFIRIRSAEAQRDRLIPIGPDLCGFLREYKAWRAELTRDSPYLFVTRKGRQSNSGSISRYFQGLRRTSGVHRRDGSRFQPRISDLRFTFAVHRISRGIESGDDLNRLLPALAAYMGQVGLGSTARYLALTPQRFKRDLDKLSPKTEADKWRDNADLMKFLDNLLTLSSS